MTFDQIKEYILLYDTAQPLSYEELPETTSGNTSYIVGMLDKQYVLRTLVRQKPESVADEYAIQKRLENAGITTPIYIQSLNGSIVETINGTSVVVSELIPGSRQPVDTIKLAQNMGVTLAKMHDNLATIHISFNEQQWFNPRNTKSQLQMYTGPEKEYIAEMTAKYSNVLHNNLPLALTHGDFHTKNVFSTNDRVTVVFDFESAEFTVRILDIARLYLTYIKVTELQPDNVIDAILTGYNSVAKTTLTEVELSELKNAFVYVALVSSVSIYNHGNTFSSEKYLTIAKDLIRSK